jgi:nitronate monooxygenase
VLAPLAGGPSTPELAAAVSDAGGLGFLGAGYLNAEALRAQVRRTRALTARPIGVNLFLLRPVSVDTEAITRYARELEAEAERAGVQLGEPLFDDDAYADKLDVVLAEGVEVVSFTFGCPTLEDVRRIQAKGSEAWVTVTSPEEARAAAAAGANLLVAQGAEAGGHRGAWTDDDAEAVPLSRLLREIASSVDSPIVATGGIANRADVLAALDAGAQAVQVGTSFLLCPEAGTNDAHRDALVRGGTTAFTRAFTGRRARGLENGFMRAHPGAPSAYPHVHHLTAPLRAAARAAGDADGFNLWAGTSFAQARAVPAHEVVAALAV